MRTDTYAFALANQAVSRRPRYVVQVIFTASSPSFTSHGDITGVPGSVYEQTVERISSVSQQVWPEEGRSTIGDLQVDLVETAAGGITAELQDQLVNNNEGIRDRELRVYAGFGTVFTDYTLVGTFFVDNVTLHKGVYRLRARDRSRELRTKILNPKETRLSAALTATATTVTVEATAGFERIAHGPGFTDAPSATVGYIRVITTGEVIRYTGSTSNSFTGCTRGLFGTKAQAVEFDGAEARERWPQVEEFIYLELPGPLMALTILTGDMNPWGTPNLVPTHWHMGVALTSLVQSAWQGVGEDLWDTADSSVGAQLRFTHLDEVEGKSFLEKEVFQPLGLYAPTTPAGKISLRRINRVIPQAGFVARLNPDSVISYGELQHDQRAVANIFRVDYNWDGDDFSHSLLIQDNDSISRHGPADTKVLKFKGMHTARHTVRYIRERLAVLRDRYAEPPLRLKVRAAPYHNNLEIGDVVDVDLPGVADYTTGSALHRPFEVQRTQIDWISGTVDLDLFASARTLESQPGNDEPEAPIPDAWYTSEGTNIASLPGYIAGSPARLSSSQALTGSASDARASASIYYHVGDLTIDAGVTLTNNNQLQLRVRGFLQINGTINGATKGFTPGGVDSDSIGATSTGWTKLGQSGYLGPTKAGDGLWVYGYDIYAYDLIANVAGGLVESRSHATAAPPLALEIRNGALTGLPAILQGSSGSSGGQVVRSASHIPPGTGGTVRGKGGNGGASGAGLLIVCRGLGFGVSGKIDLSGDDGLAGTQDSAQLWDFLDIKNNLKADFVPKAGGGAGGYPGTLYVLLDGDAVLYPAISAATFVAERGATPIEGYQALDLGGSAPGNQDRYPIPRYTTDLPGNGNLSPRIWLTGLSRDIDAAAANLWAAAHYVQYVPNTGVPVEAAVPVPRGLAATTGVGIVTLNWTAPGGTAVTVEVFASINNDRAFAEEVGEIRGTRFVHHLPDGGQRWYWVRAKDAHGRISAWWPTSATGGVVGVAQDSGLDIVLTANPNRLWNGDASFTPIVWNPTNTFTDLHCEVLRFGVLIARESVRITLDKLTGSLFHWIIVDSPDISLTASAVPANTITFRFTHVPTGLIADDEIVAVLSGASGEPGTPGRPGNRILSILRNRSTFVSATNGWLYIHGFDALGNPADVSGDLFYDGAAVVILPGSIRTSQAVSDGGWILFDTSLGDDFAHGGSQLNLAAARKTREGWRYDNGSGWATFTATEAMLVVGTYSRDATSIVTATLFGGAYAMAAIPIEAAVEVRPGDIQPGAIDELVAFAEDLRPIAIVGALPSLPSTAYPAGALVYLLSDKKIYRSTLAAPSTWTWENSVDGADIVARTVTTAALAADIVLGTLIRTANAGTRVELSGVGGDPFPLWIGQGDKGITSGTPGDGARVWYDKFLDMFGIKGTLFASKIAANKEAGLVALTAGGLDAELSVRRFNSGAVSSTASLSFGVWTPQAVGGYIEFLHPDFGTNDDSYKRLQHPEQYFTVSWDLQWWNNSSVPYVDFLVRYAWEYDESGVWTPAGSSFGFSEVPQTDHSWGKQLRRSFQAKPTGWAHKVRIRLEAQIWSTSPVGSFGYLRKADWETFCANTGSRAAIGLASQIMTP